MNVDFAVELMRWFSTSNQSELDYKDQSIRLVLKKDAAPVVSVEAAPALTPDGAAQMPGFTAQATGRFVHKHPLDSNPSAVAGRQVETGEIIGFLQIGEVLSAVEAPFAGQISEIKKPDGALTGFGDVLMSVVVNRPL
ncbi:hypothetical protein PIN31009_02972 [Pandoraea iniqua]|uniref:biotin/lipoyl-containing protein n=1 Tax=Pandoraea iniqua TaxID=2508288 RepID=UPI001241F291|nr:biotin/lipoyl-containing protein [Pandoraea iniqua]VVE17792.1 hypothetical protein PIN31009_02972 [Pandoraea iniqua]